MRLWLIVLGCGLASVPALAEDTPAPVTADPGDPTPGLMMLPPVHLHADGAIRDSLGTVAVTATSDKDEGEPECFKRVDYLRKHHDPVLAIDYLRQIIMKGDILPQDRARAILVLADTLNDNHQEAESLCWLKLWVQSFPARPEYGAVAFRIGSLYAHMGMNSLARDTYYLVLAHTINQAQVKDQQEMQYYARLTNATLWALAANEYQCGQWVRAADLFQRYRNEATGASDVSLEKAAFLQGDCDYQLKQTDKAIALYEDTLTQHPFNPLAPQARLRLYHLYVIKGQTDKAKDDLEALAWSVRTVWPKDEAYWQRQTAQLLLAINQKNAEVLPPLVKKSAQLPPEGKTWQDAINHYDALVGYQAVTTRKLMDKPMDFSKTGSHAGVTDETDLLALSHNLDEVLPPTKTAP